MAAPAQNFRSSPGDRSGDLRARKIETARAANDNLEAEITNDNASVPSKPLWARSAEAERGTFTDDPRLDPGGEIDTPNLQVRRTRDVSDAMRRDGAQQARGTLRRLKASPSDQASSGQEAPGSETGGPEEEGAVIGQRPPRAPGPSGPRMARAEAVTRNRMRMNAARLRERRSGEGPAFTLGDAQAGQVDRMLQRTDQASRARAMAQELERLRKEGASLQGERGAGGAWSRFRNARQQAQTEKALKKLKSNQAVGMLGLQLLYAMALPTWLHSLYPIALMYFAGWRSRFIRRAVPPIGTLLDPQARMLVLRGQPSAPGVGPKLAEGLALGVGIVCVFALDILLVAAVVGALEAIDTVCGTPVIGWTCDIIAEISKFFGV